jgi:hypothetical protein
MRSNGQAISSISLHFMPISQRTRRRLLCLSIDRSSKLLLASPVQSALVSGPDHSFVLPSFYLFRWDLLSD